MARRRTAEEAARWCGVLALFVAVAVAPVPAVAAPPSPILEPGQEATVQSLLSPPGGWPDGWTFRGASIGADRITGRFRRADVEVVIELGRADGEPGPMGTRSVLAGALAVSAPPEVPDALIAAVVARAAERGGELRWRLAGAARGDATATARSALGDLLKPRAEPLSPADRERAKALRDRLADGEDARWADLLLAWSAREAGDEDRARAGFQAVLESVDDNASEGSASAAREAYGAVLGARARLGLADRAAALSAFEAALAAEQPACAWAAMVADLQRAGHPSDALDVAERIATVDPGCRAAYHRGGETGGDADIEARALALKIQGAAAFPDDDDLATVGDPLSLSPQARKVFARALAVASLRSDGSGPVVRRFLAGLQRAVPDPAVVALVDGALAARPDDPAALLLAGALRLGAGASDAAIALLDRAEEAPPAAPLAALLAALGHVERNRLTEASAALARAEDAGTPPAEIGFVRGLAALRRDPRAAVAALRAYLDATEGGPVDNVLWTPEVAGALLSRAIVCLDAAAPWPCVWEARVDRSSGGKGLALVLVCAVVAALLWRRRRAAQRAAA